MARTAAEESGLPLEFAGQPPSYVLRDLGVPAFLANCGKTRESGRIFGRIIAGRLLPAGLVHLECSDRTIYAWNDADPGWQISYPVQPDFRLNGVCHPGRGCGRSAGNSRVHPRGTGLCERARNRNCHRRYCRNQGAGRSARTSIRVAPKTPWI